MDFFSRPLSSETLFSLLNKNIPKSRAAPSWAPHESKDINAAWLHPSPFGQSRCCRGTAVHIHELSCLLQTAGEVISKWPVCLCVCALALFFSFFRLVCLFCEWISSSPLERCWEGAIASWPLSAEIARNHISVKYHVIPMAKGWVSGYGTELLRK